MAVHWGWTWRGFVRGGHLISAGTGVPLAAAGILFVIGDRAAVNWVFFVPFVASWATFVPIVLWARDRSGDWWKLRGVRE